jgi:hypothetical protein
VQQASPRLGLELRVADEPSLVAVLEPALVLLEDLLEDVSGKLPADPATVAAHGRRGTVVQVGRSHPTDLTEIGERHVTPGSPRSRSCVVHGSEDGGEGGELRLGR